MFALLVLPLYCVVTGVDVVCTALFVYAVIVVGVVIVDINSSIVGIDCAVVVCVIRVCGVVVSGYAVGVVGGVVMRCIVGDTVACGMTVHTADVGVDVVAALVIVYVCILVVGVAVVV